MRIHRYLNYMCDTLGMIAASSKNMPRCYLQLDVKYAIEEENGILKLNHKR